MTADRSANWFWPVKPLSSGHQVMCECFAAGRELLEDEQD